jgi:uncharacterized protein YndB with AHSA1/START domain
MTTISIIAILMVAALAIAASKPNTFRVERSQRMNAPAEKIFPLINDLRNNLRWSPFEKDPAMKRTMSGAETGAGSVYEWDGNKQVGSGRIEITDSQPNRQVVMALDTYRPFPAHNIVTFTLATQGDATNVTWSMQGAQPFMAKLVSLFVNCEKMVGKEFEKGLTNMKAIAET